MITKSSLKFYPCDLAHSLTTYHSEGIFEGIIFGQEVIMLALSVWTSKKFGNISKINKNKIPSQTVTTPIW